MKDNNNFGSQQQQNQLNYPLTPPNIGQHIHSSNNPKYNLAPSGHYKQNVGDDITNDLIKSEMSHQFDGGIHTEEINNGLALVGQVGQPLNRQHIHPQFTDNIENQDPYQQMIMPQQRLYTDEELQQLASLQNGMEMGMIIPNYDLEFNFEGFYHQDLIERNLNMQCFLQTYTSKECIVCHPMLQQIYLNALQSERAIQDINVKKQLPHLQQIISDNLHKKYMTSKDFYNVKIVNDIIYNEPTHIVAVFKDYLIYDDLSEFLKRFYDQEEAVSRLPKICEFYEKYSKVFPNYVILPESKMMFKNIERKQKIIDDKQKLLQAKTQMKEEKIKKKMMKLNGGIMPPEAEIGPIDIANYESSMSWLKNSQRFFDTKFVDSVLKQDPLPSSNTQHSSFIQKSQLLDYSNHRKLHQINNSTHHRNLQLKSFADLNLEQLVQVFVSKDQNQMSSMNHSNITATLDITMPSFHQQDDSEKFMKAMLSQQQKQKEIIMKQMQQRKENQKLILTQKPKPQLLAAQQQISQVKNLLQQQQQDKTGNQPQTITTQNGQKFIFNTNSSVNPYLKQQKQYFEKIKTDSKRKISQGNSIQGSPQLQPMATTQATTIQSPPKVQQFQQIYGSKDIPTLKQSQIQQVQGPLINNKEIIDGKNNNIIKKKVKKSAVNAAVNLNHQQPDFKIKHGFNVPSNMAFNQLTSSQSGSITSRESIQKKLINNLIINQQQQYQSNFSPLDIQDLAQTNNQKKQKVFNYIQDPSSKVPYQAGSQSARVNNDVMKVNTSKTKANASLSKDRRQGSQNQRINQPSILQNSNLRTSNEYKSQTGNVVIPSMKNNSQDRERYQTSQNIQKQKNKPELINRINDLIRGSSENQREKRPNSPYNCFEESKQIDISNTINNQSNMHSYTSPIHQQQQQQLTQKFMNKRNSNKQNQYAENQNINQAQNSLSHGNSGYNTNSQQTNTAQTLQQTSNSSGHTHQIMKVMQLDIADISTNLNNNSRNFLARQQQQQIQLQKQSRGMNPRQKSVPKTKKTQGSQPHQNLIFVGDNNAHLYGSQIQNINNQSQIQPINSGRQSPSTARNSTNNNNNVMFDTNPVLNSQYLYQQQVVVGQQSALNNQMYSNNRYENSNAIIQNSRHVIKKVLQNTKNTQVKSNSQNRVRESSPMDYQVQLLGITIQQDTTATRIKPERQSLDRPSKHGLPYQQQINLVGDRRDSTKRYSQKGIQSNKTPSIDPQSTSRTRQSSNNPQPKKIIIGKKQNIFGVNTKAGKIL